MNQNSMFLVYFRDMVIMFSFPSPIQETHEKF